MQSSNINVLMISYGRGALYENKAGVLDRHLEYADHFNSLTIVYLTKKKLNKCDFGKLKILPVYGYSYIICFLKAIFLNFKNYQLVTTQDPFLTGLLGFFYKLRFGLKLHVQNHSNFINNKHWIKESKFKNATLNYISKKIIIPKADRIRVVNSYEKENYINLLNISKDIIDVAPISVNPIFFSKISREEINNFIEAHKIGVNNLKIGWAGRFVKLKRLDFLFELISSINSDLNPQLILAGEFNNSEYDLDLLEKRTSIKPIYTGQLSPKELKLFYETIDLFVLTSEYEGYGMVLAESLCSNCPVLVWDHSMGTQDILLQSDLAFSFHNKEDFKKKINKIIQMKPTNNSSKRILKPHLEIINSILKTLD